MSRIVTLLSKDFIVLVAFPLAWWALQKWLQDFAYRIDTPWLAFIGAAVVVLLVAILTVSLQAIKAALMNPVKSLRCNIMGMIFLLVPHLLCLQLVYGTFIPCWTEL